jgi:RNA polymerase sigma-70 factor (ECF subfamily)
MLHRPLDEARAEIERLYDLLGTPLYRYALMILADAAAAEDVVQQVFASWMRLRPKVDEGREPHYLRRAVRNECYSMLRRPAVRHVRGDSAERLLERASDDERIDERLAIEGAIRMLPAEQREVLHLHVFAGMTFKEVADATGESTNTIASRYRYALARLRDILA